MSTPPKYVRIAVAAALAVSPAWASTTPRTLHYTFYVDGLPAGGSTIRTTETGSALVFDSDTRVTLNGALIELKCHTEADPRTFEVRRFSYEGTKGGNPAGAVVHVTPDSAHGHVMSRNKPIAKRFDARDKDLVVFEDWVVELQILLARREALSGQKSTRYTFLFASSFLTGGVLAGYTSDVLLEAPGRSLTARKLVVGIDGGPPYESQVDATRGLPVYLRFPGVRSEMFLDEFFGENPPTRFPPTPIPTDKPTTGSAGDKG